VGEKITPLCNVALCVCVIGGRVQRMFMISSSSFEMSIKQKFFLFFVDVLTFEGKKVLSPVTQ
jgi:hypothetical protein